MKTSDSTSGSCPSPFFRQLASGNDNHVRKGIFLVVSLLTLSAVMSFMALSIDLGVVSLTKTRLQNAADAAALAAAQQIIVAVEEASDQAQQGQNVDINALSISASKEMAFKVAQLNGAWIDTDKDVAFGKRVFNENLGANGDFEIVWGNAPYTDGQSYNVVKVTVRKDNPDSSQPDGKLKLFFASFFGQGYSSLAAEAIAFVEARDIVSVLDYSGSMSYDSQLSSLNTFGRTALEANMKEIYESLGVNAGSMTFAPKYLTVYGATPSSAGAAKIDVTFKDTEAYVTSTMPINKIKLQFSNGSTQTFSNLSVTSGTWKGTGSYNGKEITDVWVWSGYPSATVSGQAKTSTIPHIDLTFNGTSVDVVSTSNLNSVVLNFSDGSSQTITVSGSTKTGTFAGTGSNSGKFISKAYASSGGNSSQNGNKGEKFTNPNSSTTYDSQLFEDTNANVLKFLGLTNVSYPFASGSWDEVFNYSRSNTNVKNAGYKKMYGGLTFVDYLMSSKPRFNQTDALWKAPCYPFHAMKNGQSLFLSFLKDLEFGDHAGIVTYDSEARTEHTLSGTGLPTVDLGDEWITQDYDALDEIQRHKQAGHYDIYTGIGYGVKEAREVLQNKGRFGARPTILLITDGNANRAPSGWSLPKSWNWAELTDYDGNGSADYTTSDKNEQYAFYEIKQCIDAGIVVHTMTVGADADRDLMKAMAFAAGGIWINVPGGATIADMHDQMIAAFSKIAANVPPAKLLVQPEE